MKIILIIDVRWYNACADFAIKQAQGLALLGHDVLILANPGSPPALKARDEGLKLNEEIDFSKSIKTVSSVSKLREIAIRYDANIILAHRGESHLISGLAGRGQNFRIVRFRGDVRTPRNSLFSRWLNRKLTHGVAVSTEKLRFDYERIFGANQMPLKVIYPGIDHNKYKVVGKRSDLKRKYGLRVDDPVIGMVGRLSPVKGHRFFIEAAKLTSLKYPRVQFVIAGDDAQIKSAELQISASLLKIPNSKFYGLVENIAELMASFDIGIVASIGSEMICRVLLEYFTVGLPVVATAINQISEIMLQSNGGILVPPSDPIGMSNAICDLLEDSNKNAEYSSNGSKWVRNRSLTELGNDSEAFLREVLDA